MAVTSFSGKVAAITGAGSGMGQWLAILLSRAGCEVAVADVNEAGLQETVSQLADGVRHSVHVVDMADQQAVESFAAAVISEHQQVHMIFNNAGVSVTGSVEQMPYEDMRWLMDINFWGVIYGCKSFLPHLQQVSEAAIINTSSIFGTVAVPSQSIYNASKFAVRGYTYALRQELKDTHIGVSCVQPGGVKTNIVNKSRYRPMDNQSASKEEMAVQFQQIARLSSEQAAQIILEGVLRDKARILVGNDARLLTWLERLLPLRYMKVLNRLRERNGL